jgi:cell division protease FtsH
LTVQVLVDRPDLSGRKTILEIYAKKVKLADAVDLDSVAQATSGFAGADLANLVNEAALLAARAHSTRWSSRIWGSHRAGGGGP